MFSLNEMERAFVAALLFYALQINGEPHPPIVVNNSDKPIIVSEAVPIGTLLATLEAQDADNDYLVIRHPDYATESKTLVTLNQTKSGPGYASAELLLKQKLDRDYAPDRRWLYFEIQDNSVNKFQITVAIELVISDVNDAVPVFQNLPYRLELQENTVSNRVVYRNISAKDPDQSIGGKVTYLMQPITQSTKDAKLFMETFSINNITAEIFLQRNLDYEEIQFYQFKIFALDGFNLTSTEVLTVRVLDIQDTAPQFQGTPFVVTILENTPVNTTFFVVRAMDGDRGIPNDVKFKLLSGACLSSFKIGEYTGEITVTGIVDRDAGDIMQHGGVCDLTILVSEVEQNFPQYGVTAATASISIFVTDENDNSPHFNQAYFRAYIEDTAQLNYPIKFENDTEIFIEDKDQGSSGILELILRSQDGDITYDFEPLPNVIASRGRPLIALKSPDLLRKRTEIILKLYAVERDTSEKNYSAATINIRVLPVATTTVATTTVTAKTPIYKDPFIPSVLAAVVGVLLLILALAATCYIVVIRKGVPINNKVGHLDAAHHSNGVTNGPRAPNAASITTEPRRTNDVSHA